VVAVGLGGELAVVAVGDQPAGDRRSERTSARYPP